MNARSTACAAALAWTALTAAGCAKSGTDPPVPPVPRAQVHSQALPALETTPTGAAAAPDAGLRASLQSCAQVLECAHSACGYPGTAGCRAPCWAAAADAAATKAARFFDCFDKTCVQDRCGGVAGSDCADDCFKTRCLTPLLDCMDDDTFGTRACDAMVGCMETCRLSEPRPFDCLARCYRGVSAAGKALTRQVATCTTAARTGDTMKECMAPILQCLLGGRSGAKICSAAVGCVATCASGKTDDDLACIVDCARDLTPQSQTDFALLQACTARCEAGCASQRAAHCVRGCQRQTCPAAVAACAIGD